MKERSTWHSQRIGRDMTLVRWGHYGAPVLILPTAGGDAEEIERFHLVAALWPLIEEGRIKVFSCDSAAGQALMSAEYSVEEFCRLQIAFQDYIYHEVVPAIRTDCKSPGIEVITAGASIGAFNAVAVLCRHPDAFRLAIGMSGTYDLTKFTHGHYTQDYYFASPMHFLPDLNGGAQLEALRQRFVLLLYGQGRWEDPDESWRLANLLGAKAIPNRVDVWGPEFDHDWPTWRIMLPKCLGEMA